MCFNLSFFQRGAYLTAAVLAFGLSAAAFAVTSTLLPQQAETGILRKAKKGIKHVKREAERKCSQFGRDSKVCKIAMDAAEFASPI